MMIEVVVCIIYFICVICRLICSLRQPFFHIIANIIAAEVGEDRPSEVIATTLVAFALSSILTGELSEYILGLKSY